MTSFAVVTSILTILFCAAVLVQSVRLDRALRAVRSTDHERMVVALDDATHRAEDAVRALRNLLATEGSNLNEQVVLSRHLSDELKLIVGLADAAAERVIGSIDVLAEKKVALETGAENPPAPKTARRAPKAASGEKTSGAAPRKKSNAKRARTVA